VDPLQTIINAAVVGAVGLILAGMVRGTRAEIGQLRAEVRADISNLRTEVRADISGLRREVGDLRSDLTQVALAVGARPRAGRA
jgi:hypothetical protein